MGSISNLKYKDGDDNTSFSQVDQVRIREVNNGWIVETLYQEDDGEFTDVFVDSEDLWKHLKKVFRI